MNRNVETWTRTAQLLLTLPGDRRENVRIGFEKIAQALVDAGYSTEAVLDNLRELGDRCVALAAAMSEPGTA
jgi:hypothetical protein